MAEFSPLVNGVLPRTGATPPLPAEEPRMLERLARVVPGELGGRGDFQRHAGEVLRERIVELYCETRPLSHLEVGGDVCDGLFGKFAAPLLS